MSIKRMFVLIGLVLMTATSISGQNFFSYGRFTNSTYALESKNADAQSKSKQSARIYQFIRTKTGFNNGYQISFNFAGRVLTDTQLDLTDEQRFYAYLLSLSFSNLLNNSLDFEIGRQFLHAGIPFGSIDGLQLNYTPVPDLKIKLFGGVESNLNQALKVYNFDDATVAGSEISYQNIWNNDFRLVYLQKQRQSENQWQLGGLNIKNTSVENLNINAQAHYDFLNSRFHRIYLGAYQQVGQKLNLFINLKQQFPQVYGDSYFNIFKINEYRQAQIGGNYAIDQTYSIGLRYQLLMLNDGTGHRVFTSINDKNGAISLLYETGDLGSQVGVEFDYGYQLLDNLSASVCVDYSRYRFEEIYEYENQLANAVRLEYLYSKHIRTSLEYQWLTNQQAKSDQRILNHIHLIW